MPRTSKALKSTSAKNSIMWKADYVKYWEIQIIEQKKSNSIKQRECKYALYKENTRINEYKE